MTLRDQRETAAIHGGGDGEVSGRVERARQTDLTDLARPRLRRSAEGGRRQEATGLSTSRDRTLRRDAGSRASSNLYLVLFLFRNACYRQARYFLPRRHAPGPLYSSRRRASSCCSVRYLLRCRLKNAGARARFRLSCRLPLRWLCSARQTSPYPLLLGQPLRRNNSSGIQCQVMTVCTALGSCSGASAGARLVTKHPRSLRAICPGACRPVKTLPQPPLSLPSQRARRKQTHP